MSVNKPSRKKHLEEIKDEKRTLIFYEAPHKLVSTLSDLLSVLGNREISVVKELTKIHESVFNTDLEKALRYFTENPPKGEYVLIIKGKEEEKKTFTLEDAVKIAKKYISEGSGISAASKAAAQITGIKKSDIYREICS